MLALDITREGFAWALEHAALSHYDRDVHPDRKTWQRDLKTSPVRVQWDPERSLRLGPLKHRSLQMGLSGEAVDRYVDKWITSVTDVTATMRDVGALVAANRLEDAEALRPAERPYPG